MLKLLTLVCGVHAAAAVANCSVGVTNASLKVFVRASSQVTTAACAVIANDGPVGVCWTGACEFPRRAASALVHAYLLTPEASSSGTQVTSAYLWTSNVLSLPSDSEDAEAPSPGAPAAAAFDVGILYSFFHGFASYAMSNVSAQNGTLVTVEDVIRSDGSLVIADILERYNATSLNSRFYYHATPQSDVNHGYYCVYAKRSNESVGWIPDCDRINDTLTRHAAQLVAAGVAYTVGCATNLPGWSVQADVIQQRPLEILFETWAALRAAGTPTPAITSWQTVPAGATNWQGALALYNQYPDMVYRDSGSGKMVFFVTTKEPDAGIIAAIESNGGANNVMVQQMWAAFPPAEYQDGVWAFFAPCTEVVNGTVKFTTSVVGLGRGATGCGQLMTVNSSLGTSMAISPSMQLGYGSHPFTSANKYEGLMLKRQFGTLLDAQLAAWRDGASTAPNHVMLSSWNELIAQPQPNPYNSPYAFSMGLPWDTEHRDWLWVDTYGSSMSRDLEPTVEYGTLLYDIMSSCLRVASLTTALRAAADVGATTDASWRDVFASSGGAQSALQAAIRSPAAVQLASPCSVAGEVCCAYNDTIDGYAVVWALIRNDRADALLTGNPEDLGNLTCPTCHWTQTCNPYNGPTDFCVDAALVDSPLAQQGPFVLHNGGCGAVAMQAETFAAQRGDVLSGTTVTLPDRVPLYRCFDGTHHFFDTDASCGGATMEHVLGCMHATRYSNMARALRKCTSATTGVTYHVMDGHCAAGDADAGVLGFVR